MADHDGTGNEEHTERETVREREVIVSDGSGGGGAGSVVLGIVGLIAVLVVVWVLLGSGLFSDGGDTNVDLDVPDEIDVEVDSGGN